MAGKRVRVLVAEDSLTVRKHLVEILEADGSFEVVGEAADGREAAALCEKLRPDVMTLDMVMPGMSGLDTTEYVMAHCPTPILIVSASLNRAEAFETMSALVAGALDVLDKPRSDEPDAAWSAKFRATVRLLARVPVITHPRGRLPRRPASAAEPASAPAFPSDGTHELVLIGTSAGGPAALKEIFGRLPGSFPLPIIVVVHIDRVFDAQFVEWLGSVSPFRAQHARDGMALPRRGKPTLLVAPAGRHLVLERGQLRLLDSPERHSCRPSVDVLFESAAREMGSRTVACLLTGMGTDGAAGLLALRRAGALTLVQDEASSTVFGMPREAVRIGAGTRVLPLDGFAPALQTLAAASLRGEAS